MRLWNSISAVKHFLDLWLRMTPECANISAQLLRSTFGLYWCNGEENGNYYIIIGLYRDYFGEVYKKFMSTGSEICAFYTPGVRPRDMCDHTNSKKRRHFCKR